MVSNQSAYIKGHLLLENILMATELIKDYHKDTIDRRCAFNIDISKAFNSVRWEFITLTLEAMGFPSLFICWIYHCISTANFSLVLNGVLGGFFNSLRGLRQGSFLSTYLFVIAINVLSHMLDKAARQGKIKFHHSCSEVCLMHLSFTDAMLVFLDGSPESLIATISVLSKFEKKSSLAINASKSLLFLAAKTYPSITQAVVNLHISPESLVRYLGLSHGQNYVPGRLQTTH
ncbi:uncharacterized protein LOC112087547 [Eutrema salsugineum]|uniref:uncharacterized protein LOC112087547 n=1 Tax=Eutrema salsugineum TaxID=72664 RepID=UPI000CECFEDC|nr:uncharacterized protein LOC112087547 [Eutrema salsugineum]